MKKFISLFFLTIATLLITSGELMACSLCSGQDPRDKNYIYVIGVFVILIYIPMFYLFKTFMKFRNINNSNQK